jgi:hypothetical protein
VYPELWLYEFARERQRDMHQLASRWARRGIGEEPSAPKRLSRLFRWRLKADKSLGAVGREGGGELAQPDL